MRSHLKWSSLCVLAVSVGTLGAATALEPDAVVRNYTAASEQQERAFNGSSMEVDIEASLPKLKRQGRLHALRHISRLGRITYEALRFEGDNSVKHHVIARCLTAEAQSQAEGSPSLAVTPANYKFKYKGQAQSGDRTVQVFAVTPLHKRVGLFKGEIWIDSQTFLCVRQSGRFVKTPSIFLKRIEFVKEYEIHDGFSVLRQIRSVADTRLVGPAEMTIDFRNVSMAGGPAEASALDMDEQ